MEEMAQFLKCFYNFNTIKTMCIKIFKNYIKNIKNFCDFKITMNILLLLIFGKIILLFKQ